MVAQVNNQGGKRLQALSQGPEKNLINFDELISDALFLEMCRNDENFRKRVLKIFEELKAEESNLALSSDGNQG